MFPDLKQISPVQIEIKCLFSFHFILRLYHWMINNKKQEMAEFVLLSWEKNYIIATKMASCPTVPTLYDQKEEI